MVEGTFEQLNKVKAQVRALVINRTEYAGIGIAAGQDGGYAIKVNLRAPLQEGVLPSEIEGIPIQTEITGTVRAANP
jgi:hypothetical protein